MYTATVPVNYLVMPNVKVIGHLTPQAIMEAACTAFNVKLILLLSKTRKQKVVRARNVCIYLIHQHMRYTLKEIGELFGKDHTTIIHALRCVKNELSVTAYRHQMNEDLRRVMELV